MKSLETPENYRLTQLGHSNLIAEYDCRFPKGYDYYERKPIGFEFSDRSKEKTEPSYISLDVCGKIYSVPSSLFDLVDEINDSKYILKLEDDWDNMGAVTISSELYEKAISFLLMYAIYIYKDDNKTVVQAPEINPCCNGTIDFSWSTLGARMLINIKYKSGKYIASFFGYPTSTKLPIEGLIDMSNIDKDMASWMKKLK
jgi:hypothetical protein